MERLFDLHVTFTTDPAITRWWAGKPPELAAIARTVFTMMRACSPDVREALHDNAPTACIGNYPFGYVNVYSAHVNVGFFYGAFLADPGHLLEGTGKRMRHVKVKPGDSRYEDELLPLVLSAYADLAARLRHDGKNG